MNLTSSLDMGLLCNPLRLAPGTSAADYIRDSVATIYPAVTAQHEPGDNTPLPMRVTYVVVTDEHGGKLVHAEATRHVAWVWTALDDAIRDAVHAALAPPSE